MSLGDVIGAALPELRLQAESLMVDTCTITRAGSSTWDASAGKYTSGEPDDVYAGPCRVQTRDVQPGSPEAGEVAFTSLAFVVQVPIAVDDVAIGDTVTITASVFDSSLVDRSFRVVGLVHKTHLTARRLVCEEIQ